MKQHSELEALKITSSLHEELFAHRADHVKLKKRFDVFSQIETVELLEGTFMPLVEGFSKKL
jgi:hypothetical protein